ncbi:hypothetical protein BB412_03675 [Helicobacter pylori]|nr:SabA family sialic acid-binding adhesin [Helicobacter pylori]PDW18069.1 hypothetical protein BB412_03675 [Helicobacter pylori]
MKIKKSLLLSLSLMLSLSRAEDDGFYMSVGYQIGEAVQQVKNTGALQNLADRYDNLSNLLNQYNYLNSLVNLASYSLFLSCSHYQELKMTDFI